MDENKPPEEPTPTPTPEPTPEPVAAPAPAPVAPPEPSAAQNFASAATAGTPKGGPVPFAGPPDPSVPQDERTQAMLMWILGLFIGIISPIIFYFISADKPFVKHHAAQSLTFSIAMIVLYIIAFILMFVVIGMFLIPLIILAGLAITIMGAIAANAGSRFEPPVTGNLAKSWFKA